MANEIESTAALASTVRASLPVDWSHARRAIDELERRAVATSARLEESPQAIGNRLREALVGYTSSISRFADVYELEKRAVANEGTGKPMQRAARALGEAKNGEHASTNSEFRALLSAMCGAASMDVTVASIVPHAGGGKLYDLHPSELTRDGGSLSHKVADDGKCSKEDLGAIAEINGYDLLVRSFLDDGRVSRVETLRGRARVLGCKFEPPLPPAVSCAHAIARFRSELEALCGRHGVEVEVGHIESGACVGVRDVKSTTCDIEKALKNMGHDVECGACMSVAFTGVRTAAHTCKQNEAARTLAALDAISTWRDSAPRGASRTFSLDYGGMCTVKEATATGEGGSLSKTKSFGGSTRLACLEAAAEWCKKAGA